MRYKVKRFNTFGDKRFWTWAVWDNLKNDYIKTAGNLRFTIDSPIKASMKGLANLLEVKETKKI